MCCFCVTNIYIVYVVAVFGLGEEIYFINNPLYVKLSV